LKGLYESGVLFDFANAWTAERDSIAKAASFALNEDDWSAFVDFTAASASAEYESQTSLMWNQLKELAQEEEVYTLNYEVFQNLELALKPNIERDLSEFRPQIQRALEEEIVMRYYLQDGVFEWSLPRDSTLTNVIELLNSGQYKTILAGVN
jgi:carboxyl-terminal processing protease